MIRWGSLILVLLLVVILADIFTTTPRSMAAIKKVLENNGTLGQVELLTHLPSQIFYPDHVLEPSCIRSVKFWKPQPRQEVRWYAKEAMPCYFDLWLLVDTSSGHVLDWRLFRLDQAPTK